MINTNVCIELPEFFYGEIVLPFQVSWFKSYLAPGILLPGYEKLPPLLPTYMNMNYILRKG